MVSLTAEQREEVAKCKTKITMMIVKYTKICSSTEDAFKALYSLFAGCETDEFDNTMLFDFYYGNIRATIKYNTKSKKVTLGRTCDILNSKGDMVKEGYYW